MNYRWFRIAIVILLVGATFCAQAAEVTVFAAASLTDSLKEIGTNWEKQSGDKIVFNFAGSSTLERQIEEGAPADIFFSADEAKMDALEKKQQIVKESRRSLLGNSLVVVVAAGGAPSISNLADLAGAPVKHVALADTKTVPAGIYARQCLEKLKLWSAVEPKVIPTENVRAALAAVESGNVEAAIVYKTDAAISKKVTVVYEVPAVDSPDISYPVALIKDGKHAEAAKKFLSYLEARPALDVFHRYGFLTRD